MARASSHSRLRAAIVADRRRIAAGGRPGYHVRWVATLDGSAVDVTIAELPLIHILVPDRDRVLDGARGLIARTLAVDPMTFDLSIEPP